MSNYIYVLQNSEGDLSMSQEHVGPNSMPSDSTAPYVDPYPVVTRPANLCSGNDDTCGAYSTKSSRNTPTPLCHGCTRSAQLEQDVDE